MSNWSMIMNETDRQTERYSEKVEDRNREGHRNRQRQIRRQRQKDRKVATYQPTLIYLLECQSSTGQDSTPQRLVGNYIAVYLPTVAKGFNKFSAIVIQNSANLQRGAKAYYFPLTSLYTVGIYSNCTMHITC